MRKLLVIVIVICLFVTVLAGCGKKDDVDIPGNQSSQTPATSDPTGNSQTPATGNPTEIQTQTDISTLTDAEIYNFDPATNTLKGFQESIIGVTDIIIPNEIEGSAVRIIAANAFDAKGLKSVVLPSTLEKIEQYAFANNSISEIVFPDSVSVIETAAFVDNKLTKLTIPMGITEIAVQAFSKNLIAELNLPNTLTVIRRSAFRSNLLTEINFPSSLLVIESNAFQENLFENLVFNDGLEVIAGYAFDSNKLKSITIPASVKQIGYPTEGATPVSYYERFTFAYNNLESVTILASDIDMDSFLLTDNNYFKNAYLKGGPGKYEGTQIGKWEKVY